MKIMEKIKQALAHLLNTSEIKSLGCNMSPYMEHAVRIWDELFYVIDSPPHSLHLVQTITAYMATLATSELTLDAGASQRGKYITDQVTSHIQPLVYEAVQLAGAGGMAAVKPYMAKGEIYAEIIPRDRIYPTRFGANNRIEAGFFTDFAENKEKPVVRLESFDLTSEGLRIANHAYQMRDNGLLGREIPLDTIQRWAELEEAVQIDHVDRPHFGIIRMPMINNIDASPYPISIFANACDTIIELDKTYAQLLWERDTGKRRMILDRTVAGKDPINGKPVIPFRDLTSDYYMTIDMPEEKPWDDYTPEMRIEKYREAIDMQLRILELQTGFSPGTFQIDVPGGRVTATQIISEDRTTYNTVKAIQERGMIPGLTDVLYWVDVCAGLYGLAPNGSVSFSVSCGDSIFEDTGIEFQRRKAMADAKYIRPELFTSWYFGVSEEEAREMLPNQETADDIFFGGRQ